MVKLYSGFVLLLILIGIAFRRKRKIHVPIMVTGLVLDLASVLYLEISRHVIMEAFERVPEFLMKIHLTLAVLTLSGWAIAFTTGILILSGKQIQKIHKINAAIFLISRTALFITTFWIVE